MSIQLAASVGLFALGLAAIAVAVYHERAMQHHRQPGVSYSTVTFRRDGAWRRADLFTPDGLAHQRKASIFGMTGVLLWIAALGAYVFFGHR